MKVELCNECHPFYTGQQKFVDTGGRVQRFADKFGGAAAAQLKNCLLYTSLAAGRLILAPLSPLLPFLQISDGEYTYYDGSKEYLLWVATAVAVSFLAARLNKRERCV